MDSVSMPTAAPRPDGGFLPLLVRGEAVLTALEVFVIGLPIVRAAGDAGGFLPSRTVAMTAGALWLATVLRLFDVTRPISALVSAKRRQHPVAPEAAVAAQRALARVPIENGWWRLGAWTVVLAVALGFAVVRRGLDPLLASGLLGISLIHAGALAALRTLWLERALSGVRPIILPAVDLMSEFMTGYPGRLARMGLVCTGLVTASFLVVARATTRLDPRSLAALGLFLWPVMLLAAGFSARSFTGRRRPIDDYFGVLFRQASTRGLSREEPTAASAFRAAQALPYRLALYQGFGLLLALIAAVAAARRLFGWDATTAAVLLTGVAVLVPMSVLYGITLQRLSLRPLLRHLGSRHHLPLASIRSPFGLRAKLVVSLILVGGAAAGFVALAIAAARTGGGGVSGATILALGAAWIGGAIFLVTRDFVNPLTALDGRSDEMARGELARPVPPAGEADEIGRLTVAFEEMRRALRDRLRSTESINVDLEREVRRRTDALEQRNAEIRDALEKLEKAQDDLVRSEKLASMGRLVAGIAHEINNPVNAVINSLGPLQESLHEMGRAADPAALAARAAEAETMLAVIQRGADRTKAIVRALHNYSRGDDTAFTEVDLGRCVDDTLDLLRHRLRDVRITRAIDAGARVWGLAGQLSQVLMNLITNAAQALGERGGTISIEATAMVDGVRIVIGDDGPGIPADVLPRIFDPFFTTKAVGEGSGLGLSIVHGIIERHGGRIDVQSAPGKGTRFTIDLPRGGAGEHPVPAVGKTA